LYGVKIKKNLTLLIQLIHHSIEQNFDNTFSPFGIGIGLALLGSVILDSRFRNKGRTWVAD
jgi:hypothetical protein